MIKNKSTLEIKKDERIYQFMCDSDAPLGEVFDSLSAMKGYVVEIIQKSEPKIEQQEKSEEKE